jgi:hypothetical protein
MYNKTVIEFGFCADVPNDQGHGERHQFKACFKRRASHVPNALETIDNEAFQLIIYCF